MTLQHFPLSCITPNPTTQTNSGTGKSQQFTVIKGVRRSYLCQVIKNKANPHKKDIKVVLIGNYSFLSQNDLRKSNSTRIYVSFFCQMPSISYFVAELEISNGLQKIRVQNLQVQLFKEMVSTLVTTRQNHTAGHGLGIFSYLDVNWKVWQGWYIVGYSLEC